MQATIVMRQLGLHFRILLRYGLVVRDVTERRLKPFDDRWQKCGFPEADLRLFDPRDVFGLDGHELGMWNGFGRAAIEIGPARVYAVARYARRRRLISDLLTIAAAMAQPMNNAAEIGSNHHRFHWNCSTVITATTFNSDNGMNTFHVSSMS